MQMSIFFINAFHSCHTLAIYENGTTHLLFENQSQVN